jgi:2Fe-2S ferredoxin
MLEMTAAPAEATSRLSCQIVLTPALDGLVVRLPLTQY